MALQQGPTQQDLGMVAGNPFGLLVVATFTDSSDAPIAWDDISLPTMWVGGEDALVPIVTPSVVDGQGQWSINWTAAQTSALQGVTTAWTFSCYIEGSGPFTLITGTIMANSPTTPGVSTQATDNLSVSVGTTTSSLSVAVGIGAQGFQGAQGYQGVQGTQGYQGSQGSQGYQGADGTQGSQGSTGAGTQGFTGSQGATGSQGSTGSQGATGPQGLTGSQGATGAQGMTGSQGSTGSGSQGAQGSQGSQGHQGATGSGAQGAQGFQGATGAQGDTGAQGATGSGSQGSTGSQGSQGYQGAQGATGVGTQGSSGAQGDTGTQGPQGSQGGGGGSSTGSMPSFDFPGPISTVTSDCFAPVNNVTFTKYTIVLATEGSTATDISILLDGNSVDTLSIAGSTQITSGTLSTPITMTAGTDFVQVQITTAGTGAAGLSVMLG